MGNHEKNAERMNLNQFFLPSKTEKSTIRICFFSEHSEFDGVVYWAVINSPVSLLLKQHTKLFLAPFWYDCHCLCLVCVVCKVSFCRENRKIVEILTDFLLVFQQDLLRESNGEERRLERVKEGRGIADERT